MSVTKRVTKTVAPVTFRGVTNVTFRAPPKGGGTLSVTDRQVSHSVTLSRSSDEGCLLLLADRICRLAPSHRDPEAFHIEKSEIVAELRLLARGSTRHG